MTASAEAEPLNRGGFATFAERAAEGTSLNLLALKPEGGREQAFLDMIGSAEYQAVGHLRTEALTRGELHPMDPDEGAP